MITQERQAASHRVLLVDDQLGMIETLADILEEHGYQVTVARSGAEALKQLALRPADVVFIDLMMPGLNGLETARVMKSLHAHVPVVMMTGYGADPLLQDAQHEDLVAVLQKPVDPDLVLTIARSLLSPGEQTLYVIGDETASHSPLLELLRGAGYRATWAHGPGDVSGQGRWRQSALLVVDLSVDTPQVLPVLDAARHDRLPVILLGSASVLGRYRAFAVDCLTKPCRPSAVLRAVQRALVGQATREGVPS